MEATEEEIQTTIDKFELSVVSKNNLEDVAGWKIIPFSPFHTSLTNSSFAPDAKKYM